MTYERTGEVKTPNTGGRPDAERASETTTKDGVREEIDRRLDALAAAADRFTESVAAGTATLPRKSLGR